MYCKEHIWSHVHTYIWYFSGESLWVKLRPVQKAYNSYYISGNICNIISTETYSIILSAFDCLNHSAKLVVVIGKFLKFLPD